MAAEREHTRWRTFHMDMEAFIESNHAILGLPDLNVRGREWDKDEVARLSHRLT